MTSEPVHPTTTRRGMEHYEGCLVGGAVGDALGAAVEFMGLSEIVDRFGPAGIQEFVPTYGKLGAITDDTQMTLFTAEGALRRENRWRSRGIASMPSHLHHAYLRWLHTQGEESSFFGFRDALHGFFIRIPELHARRGPGNTNLSALMGAKPGSIEEPINESKGCGAVMRVAPLGLLAQGDQVFRVACESGAITHGHPSGHRAAGAFARVIASLVLGRTLVTAIDDALDDLAATSDGYECRSAITFAVDLAKLPASREHLRELGEGWVAEECLAIALYCALVSPDFRSGVELAVNHSGDSDSTGSLAGQLLGLQHGLRGIPHRWLAAVELRNVVRAVSRDLYAAANDPELDINDFHYPASY